MTALNKESKKMVRQLKLVAIHHTASRLYSGETRDYGVEIGTLAELIENHYYTLECGKAYEHERGNRKINMSPKTVKSLCTNLMNAADNSSRNGYSGSYYEPAEITQELFDKYIKELEEEEE